MSKCIRFSFFLLCVLICHNNMAQISFSKMKWEDALITAKEENKPIFIDFYTTWCGPCKVLDKNAFQDQELGAYMNEQFICLKYDAENPNFDWVAKKYTVQSYPTLLYFNASGKLIHRVSGIRTAEDLMKTNHELHSFLLNKSLQGNIENFQNLSMEELKELLENSSEITFENKAEILELFLTMVENNGQSWVDYEDLVMSNFDKSISNPVFKEIIDNAPKSKMFPKPDEIKLHLKLMLILNHKIRKATNENDFDLFEDQVKIFEALSLKRMEHPIKIEKDINKYYLSFYKRNEIKQEYATLATSMIEQYILPYSPEQVKEMEFKNIGSLTNKLLKIEEEEVKESKFEKYKNDHFKGFQVGERLNEISKTFLSFFEDQAHLEQAKEWSRMSIEYFNHPKYYKNYSAILMALGQHKEAEVQISKGKKVEALMEM